MNTTELKPASVFEQFARINAIPRQSKHEEKMTAYLKEWGESHNLETKVDKIGNVIIRKPATKGMEQKPVVVLQSHMDMVCDKLVDVEFDFLTEPIRTKIEGEWLTAEGTTLGADDGIGCAIALAILEANDIEHGPIEAVFTVDEETQLTGATNMEAGFMTGDMLINLDSEDEGQIFVSCAGGKTTFATFEIEKETAPDGYFFMEGSVKGLKGGHSGDDIEKKRANAIKLLARFIYKEMEKTNVLLADFHSGKAHNAIPRDGRFVIAVPEADKEMIRADWNIYTAEVEDEFHVSDNEVQFNLGSTDAQPVIAGDAAGRIIRALQAVDNGVYAMCQDEAVAWLVETSSNLAVIDVKETAVDVIASQRSSVMSNLTNMCNTVKAVFELAGAKVELNDGYPAWKMNPNSRLTEVATETYKELFGKEPEVKGIHAGLECGLFSERYPNMDMISFGPTLRGVHTPEERLLIPTVDMVWQHLLLILKRI